MNQPNRQTGTGALVVLMVLGLLMFRVSTVSAEEWTAAQKEVWELVEEHWEAIKEGDTAALMELMHEDAMMWWSSQPNPLTKVDTGIKYSRWFSYDANEFYLLHPLFIGIFDDVAIVHYYFKFKGPKMSDRGRASVTFIQQDGKWKQIGGLNSSCEKIGPCAFY